MKNVFILGAACVAGFAVSASAAPSAAKGKETFLRVGCYQCHGTEGQGSGAGLKLAPDPLPAEAIANFIRGKPGTMPPYPEAVLSDAEIADIAAYLASIRPSPTVDRIPVLRDLKLPN